MSENTTLTWRDTLNIVADSISAEQFHEELAWLREEYGDAPDDISEVYTGILAEWFVESAGLFAALALPPDEVPDALAKISATLALLDFDRELERVPEDERIYYADFAAKAAPAFTRLGTTMEALLGCYVAGDYDSGVDPNALVVEALEIAGAEDDLARAHQLITRAGATALEGRPLWWRWSVEARGPAAEWLVAIASLVEDYTAGGRAPLGSLEQAQADAEVISQEVEKISDEDTAAEDEPAQAAFAPSPVDDLIEKLIELGTERFTPEQLDLCQAHRNEAIPVLIDLAMDEYLQTQDSPGDGYAPIRAVQLLGELGAAEAVPALIDIVADTDYMAIIHSAAIHALEKIGPPALEPLLDFLRYSRDVDAKTAVVSAVAEASQDDDRAYAALVQLWKEASWESGKSLLAYHLVELGGERAIPLLETALEAQDPEMDWMDFNEVASALGDLGIEVPAESPQSPFDGLAAEPDIERFTRQMLVDIADPARMMAFAETAPEDWHAQPDTIAHTYTEVHRASLNQLLAVQTIILPPERCESLITSLLHAAGELAFDAPTTDCPRWLRESYTHLAECAGPEFQLHVAGLLLALRHYLSEDYDIADDPAHLLAAARTHLSGDAAQKSPLGDAESRRLFGRAGALILRGRSFWPRWAIETDNPLSGWMYGLIGFRRPLERIGQIPLRPSSEADPTELFATLMEAMAVEEKEPPPSVAKLLDLLITREQDSLPPAQRRQFAHHHAAIAPYLIRMVEDKRYWYQDGPGGGWAAILAVRLLGELKVAQAADTLVDAVADSTTQDVIHDAALFSLMAIGRPALPAVQSYFHYGRQVETKTSLAEVLGRISRRKTGSFDLLRQVWDTAGWTQNRRTVALAFGDLHDRRAIPLLQAAQEDPSADALDQDYVRWALQRLGAPTPVPPGKKSPHLRTPPPHNPRLLYGELDTSDRLRYSTWGEPLCPDCGRPLVLEEDGTLTHPPEQPTRRPGAHLKHNPNKHPC